MIWMSFEKPKREKILAQLIPQCGIGLSFPSYAAIGSSLYVSLPGGVSCSQSTFQRRQLVQKQCEMGSVPWLRSPLHLSGLVV